MARMIGGGRFIAIEGQDGAGKTELVERLSLALDSDGYSVVTTAEPSDGPVGVLLRDLLEGRARVAKDVKGLLFAADRVDHVARTVVPALNVGAIVLCSRYVLSNLVYRGAESASPLFECESCGECSTDEILYPLPNDGGWPRWRCPHCKWLAVTISENVGERIRWTRRMTWEPMMFPDLTVVLSLQPSTAAERRNTRNTRIEAYDGIDMQRRVAAIYQLAGHLGIGPVAMIDASGTPEAVVAAALEAVLGVVNKACKR